MEKSLFNSIIDIFCDTFHASETSAHRTIDRNRQVGGAPTSQHLGYKAVDLVLDDWDKKAEALEWLRRMKLFVLDESATKNHIHVDDRHDSKL